MTRARILADYVAGGTTATEFDHLDGVTSNVQTQLDAKLPKAGGTMTGDLVPATPLSHRNMIINGAMQVAQRGNVTIPHSGTGVYTAKDRFSIYNGSSAEYTTKASEAAYPIEGFPQCLQLDVTTSDTGLTAGDRSEIVYKAEGQDLQAWNKGRSTAKPVTLSFWIRTSVTGTYILECYDADNTRHICKSYTVSSANTWEKKVITIDADTTGTFDNDTSESLSIRWWLIAGTTYNSGTLQTTWASAVSANRAVGQVNAVASTSNFIYLTGVQLELGSSATPFEHKSYADELRLCERYYQKVGGNIFMGTTSTNTYFSSNVNFKTEMVGTPTADYGGFSGSQAGAIVLEEITTRGCRFTALAANGSVSAYGGVCTFVKEL